MNTYIAIDYPTGRVVVTLAKDITKAIASIEKQNPIPVKELVEYGNIFQVRNLVEGEVQVLNYR